MRPSTDTFYLLQLRVNAVYRDALAFSDSTKKWKLVNDPIRADYLGKPRNMTLLRRAPVSKDSDALWKNGLEQVKTEGPKFNLKLLSLRLSIQFEEELF